MALLSHQLSCPPSLPAAHHSCDPELYPHHFWESMKNPPEALGSTKSWLKGKQVSGPVLGVPWGQPWGCRQMFPASLQESAGCFEPDLTQTQSTNYGNAFKLKLMGLTKHTRGKGIQSGLIWN